MTFHDQWHYWSNFYISPFEFVPQLKMYSLELPITRTVSYVTSFEISFLILFPHFLRSFSWHVPWWHGQWCAVWSIRHKNPRLAKHMQHIKSTSGTIVSPFFKLNIFKITANTYTSAYWKSKEVQVSPSVFSNKI